MTDNDPVSEIKRTLSAEQEIKRAASDWRKDTGGDRVGRCTHPEHGHTSSSGGTPNLIVTEDDAWHCYSHGTGGGVFEWVAVEEGICSCSSLPLTTDQFKETLRVAADRAGVDLIPESVDEKDLSPERRARHALDTVVDILHDNLDTVVDGKTVRTYLKEERGFTDDSIDQARIGFLDDKTHQRILDEVSPDALQEMGLYRDNKSLHCNNRIFYPYLEGGLPTYWAARKTEDSPNQDNKYMKPSSGSSLSQSVYVARPPDGNASKEEVWVTEGMQDAISMAQEAGVLTVSPVASKPSNDQRQALVDWVSKKGRAVICFDHDEAGQSAASRLAIDLMRKGVDTDIATVPDADPNDFFVDGGDFAEIGQDSAVVHILNEQGTGEPVVEKLLSTVEPDTMRADRVISKVADETEYRKKTLRRKVKQKYRYEEQQGWMEPSAIEKTAGVDTTWRFIYPTGDEIELDSITGYQAAQKFNEKYAVTFNFDPNLDGDEWTDNVNEWLSEVAVTEVDPLTEEARVREKVMTKLQTERVGESFSIVPDTPLFSAGYCDGNILVLTEAIQEWTSDFDASLQKVREYLQPIMDGSTKTKTVDYKRYRVWPIDPDSLEDEGFSAPEPDRLPDDTVVDIDSEEADDVGGEGV